MVGFGLPEVANRVTAVDESSRLLACSVEQNGVSFRCIENGKGPALTQHRFVGHPTSLVCVRVPGLGRVQLVRSLLRSNLADLMSPSARRLHP